MQGPGGTTDPSCTPGASHYHRAALRSRHSRISPPVAGRAERGLRHEAGEAEHRQPAVLELGHAARRRVHLERIVEAHPHRKVVARLDALPLGVEEGGDLEQVPELQSAHRKQQRPHVARRPHGVVRLDRRHPLEDVAREADAAVDGEEAGHGEHADAAVLELGLSQPVDVVRLGEVERVEDRVLHAVLSDHLVGALGAHRRCHTGGRAAGHDRRGAGEGGRGRGEGASEGQH